jgi:hypothetical protein
MTNDYQLNIYSELSSSPVPNFLPRIPKSLRGQTQTNKPKLPILFTVNDYKGILCFITQVRPTNHGFDVLYGYPETKFFGLGPQRLISTRELFDFWEKYRTSTEFVTYDLPIGRTTIKRARKRLGFNFRTDTSKFWMDRLEELKAMPVREFAAKHGVNAAVAGDMRRKLVGNTARPVGWWNKPTILQYLRSGVTLTQICEKLGVKHTQACRLRTMAQQKGNAKIKRNTPVALTEGWWRTPETIATLLSGAPLAEIATKLGIANMQASRLRGTARRIYATPAQS